MKVQLKAVKLNLESRTITDNESTTKGYQTQSKLPLTTVGQKRAMKVQLKAIKLNLKSP